jgi:hypothetical protein
MSPRRQLETVHLSVHPGFNSRVGLRRTEVDPAGHQPLQIGFPRKRSQDAIQNAHFNPSIVAPLDRLVVAQLPRQIPPASA